MKKRIGILITVLFLVVPLLVLAQTDVSSLIAQLQAQIAVLQAQIKQLMAQQGGSPTWCHTFNMNLRVGDRGEEVRALNTSLLKEGVGSPINLEGQSSLVSDDGVLIEVTAAAVTEFQEKYRNEILTPNGLRNGTGYVGPATRRKLNQLYGCGVTPPPVADRLYMTASSDLIGTFGEYASFTFKAFGGSGRYYIQVVDGNIPGLSKVQSYQCPSNTDCLRSDNLIALAGVPTKSGVYAITFSVEDLNDKSKYAIEKFNITIKDKGVPSITVLSPNGGEGITLGQSNRVSWRFDGDMSKVRYIALWLYRNERPVGWVTPQFSSLTSPSGSYTWDGYYTDSAYENRRAADVGGGYKILAIAFGANDVQLARDQSDSPFSIVAGTQSISGELDTRFAQVGYSTNYALKTSSGVVPLFIAGNAVITDLSGNKLSFSDLQSGMSVTAFGSKNSYFSNAWDVSSIKILSSVTQPSITVTSPNGGETWQVGTTQVIKWTSQNMPPGAIIHIKLQREDGYSELANVPASLGSFYWFIPSTLSAGLYSIHLICSGENIPITNCGDTSDYPFSITGGNLPTVTSFTVVDAGEAYLNPALGGKVKRIDFSTKNAGYANLTIYPCVGVVVTNAATNQPFKCGDVDNFFTQYGTFYLRFKNSTTSTIKMQLQLEAMTPTGESHNSAKVVSFDLLPE